MINYGRHDQRGYYNNQHKLSAALDPRKTGYHVYGGSYLKFSMQKSALELGISVGS